MKKIVLAIVIFSFCAGIISAQPFPPSKEKQLKHLKRVLQLNDSQMEKLRDILTSFETKITGLHQKIEAARKKDMEEMEKIKTDQEDQISKLLNGDQKKKFEELNDELMMPPPPGMFNAPNHGGNTSDGPGRCGHPPMKEGTDMQNPEHRPYEIE